MDSNKFIYALDERIGNPELFVGRKEELEYLNDWLLELPEKMSQSTCILSRRKKGKTALVERFYNIIYNKNSNIIPFYYEISEGSKWLVDFSLDFYTSFISQYLGFKLKDILLSRGNKSIRELESIAQNNNIEIIVSDIKSFKDYFEKQKNVNNIWKHVQSAPHRIASVTGDFIVQIIDEFQFINSEIFRDKDCKIGINDLAGTYLSLAESKIAPMLVTGSWIGWLKGIIRGQLPARFRELELGNLSKEEGLEAIFNYSIRKNIEITDEVAVYLNELVNSDPYYISALIRSFYKNIDLTSKEGLMETLEYEVRKGDIYSTWMEYILKAIDKVNDHNAKNIVLFLSKNRDKEWTRKDIIKNCALNESEVKVEKKLNQLVKGDLISEGSTSLRYKGMSDDIFYKVFRYRYGEEIDNFSLEEIIEDEKSKENKKFLELKKELKSIKYSYDKGHYLEYLLIKNLKFGNFFKKGLSLKELVYNYQDKAKFTEYQQVKNRVINLEGGKKHELDIYAQAKEKGQDLYIEVKNWKEPVNKSIVEDFLETKKALESLEKDKGYFLYYSLNGFTKTAEELLMTTNIMYTDAKKWKIDFL